MYLELLKEREKREPQNFLKCHFFNTFFYKKVGFCNTTFFFNLGIVRSFPLYVVTNSARNNFSPFHILWCYYSCLFVFLNLIVIAQIISGKGGYDYKSVRRWTSQRKLGYGLIECDKVN